MDHINIYKEIANNISHLDKKIIEDIFNNRVKFYGNKNFLNKYIVNNNLKDDYLFFNIDRDGIPHIDINKKDYIIHINIKDDNRFKYSFIMNTTHNNNTLSTLVNKYEGIYFEKLHPYGVGEFLLFDSDICKNNSHLNFANKTTFYKNLFYLLLDNNCSLNELVETSNLIFDVKIEKDSEDYIFLNHMFMFKKLSNHDKINNINQLKI